MVGIVEVKVAAITVEHFPFRCFNELRFRARKPLDDLIAVFIRICNHVIFEMDFDCVLDVEAKRQNQIP